MYVFVAFVEPVTGQKRAVYFRDKKDKEVGDEEKEEKVKEI